MIYVNLPEGGSYGWGTCGDNLFNAIAAITPARRLWGQPMHTLSGPLLQVFNANLLPVNPELTAPKRLGFVVFEKDLLARREARRRLMDCDHIVTASRWAEGVLREGGLSNVTTILHGVDRKLFNSLLAPRRTSKKPFIIFSGGKFEFRKGQDIVVKAFLEFSRKHSDAILAAAWHNPWMQLTSMKLSPYWPYDLPSGQSFEGAVRDWLLATGVDLERVILIPPKPHAELAHVYGNSDIGLFPNRCEGATNLIMMEYMACGGTVIATDFAGHQDVLTDGNSLPLRRWLPFAVFEDGQPVACWAEPDVAGILERLEYAYDHRDEIRDLGYQAAADLSHWTWEKAALQLVELLVDQR